MQIQKPTAKVLVSWLLNHNTDEGGHTISIDFTAIDFSAPVGAWVPWHHVVRQRIFYLSYINCHKVVAHYNGHVQIMIFTDCLVLLLLLSHWGHSESIYIKP